MKERENHVMPQTYHPLPVTLVKGKGIWVWADDGKKYLDMLSGYSALSHGHCHDRLVKVMHEQAQTLTLTSRAFYTDKLAPFMEKLVLLTGLDMAIPMNTGAEAVETALKGVRRWGYRTKGIPKDQAEIIVARNNFHGRTLSVISFSTDKGYRSDFGPLTPGFKAVPFGDAKALEKAITKNTCAVLLEPIQGEGGVNIPPAGYFKQVERICRDNQVLLVLDEIQVGLGRTGKLFAFQHEEIKPDGLILGKALGGGMYPVSAFVATKQVMQHFDTGSHGSTFGGNPLGATLALEALNIIEDESLVERSAMMGNYLLDKVSTFEAYPFVKEVRGRGLFIGIEIDSKLASARKICEGLMRKGILCKETHGTVVRLAPPLIITLDEIDYAFKLLKTEFDAV